MKTTKKWSKMLLVGMFGMVLALGLVLMGCPTDADASAPGPGLYIGNETNPQTNTNTLALALAWLKVNAASDTDYTILLGADESLPPWTLGGTSAGDTIAANGTTGVTITLKGKDTERTVQLSEIGSLFTVLGVTLILDENISLNGGRAKYCVPSHGNVWG